MHRTPACLRDPGQKKASKRPPKNSAKHYLTAKQLIVPGEDPAEYTELLQGLEQSWNPANTQESLLVEQIAQNAWRLMRVRRMEAATFERWMPSLQQQEAQPLQSAGQEGITVCRAPENHDHAMVVAFEKFNKAFDNLRRYTTPIERAYHNAIAELTKLQKQRKIQEIGSVSQKPKAPECEPQPIVPHEQQMPAPAAQTPARPSNSEEYVLKS